MSIAEQTTTETKENQMSTAELEHTTEQSVLNQSYFSGLEVASVMLMAIEMRGAKVMHVDIGPKARIQVSYKDLRRLLPGETSKPTMHADHRHHCLPFMGGVLVAAERIEDIAEVVL